MLPTLTRNWAVVAVRGIAAILFGILAFAVPGLTLASLVLLFGAFALVDGVAALLAGVRAHPGAPGHRWLLIAIGAAGITAGILTFIDPTITALALLYLIATWAIVVGILQIVAALSLRRELEREVLLILGGIASVAFGIILLVAPDIGLLSLIWLVGAYAIVFGLSSLALAIRLRGLHRQATRVKPVPSSRGHLGLGPPHDASAAG
jgi:uncharacterized membrane protein HdeD (DUF308 family)